MNVEDQINPPKLVRSFRYALYGIYHAVKYNQNMKVHILTSIGVVIASLLLHVNAFQMGILGVMILLVLSAEMVNTAIEEMVDLITTERRMQAKIAKDVAAGMVLVTAFGSMIVGFLIFTPYVLKLFR